MLIFKSETTIEFHDKESLETFVRTMPLPREQQLELLEMGETVDEDDEVDVTGAGEVIHKFTIEGEE